jgi:hypothetical protein
VVSIDILVLKIVSSNELRKLNDDILENNGNYFD